MWDMKILRTALAKQLKTAGIAFKINISSRVKEKKQNTSSVKGAVSL